MMLCNSSISSDDSLPFGSQSLCPRKSALLGQHSCVGINALFLVHIGFLLLVAYLTYSICLQVSRVKTCLQLILETLEMVPPPYDMSTQITQVREALHPEAVPFS